MRRIVVEIGTFMKCPVTSLMPIRLHEKPLEAAKIAEERFRRDMGCEEKKEIVAAVEIDGVIVELHGKPDCVTNARIYEYKNISRPDVSIWAIMEKMGQAAMYSYAFKRNGVDADAYAVFEVQGQRYFLKASDILVKRVEKWIRDVVEKEVPFKHIKCDANCRYYNICRLKDRITERIVDDVLLKYSLEAAQKANLPVRPLRYVIV
mgnify:CR=1 FL=1